MASQILIDEPSFTVSGRELAPRPDVAKDGCPLIVAIHGGGFNHDYFDVPGYSLFDRAAARGFGVLGLDRLGYARSRADGLDTQSFGHNKQWLSEAIGRLWPRYQDRCDGVVLVGHSIGGALSLMLAGDAPAWPVAGAAVSGVSLTGNPALHGFFDHLPPQDWMDSANEQKDRLMMGAPGTYDPAVLDRLHPAYRPVSTRELVEIYSEWPQKASEVLKAARVPVQFRMGEADMLCVVDDAAVRELSALLSGVAGSTAAIVRDAGHAIDFHEVGADFQDRQLDFALDCVRR